MKQFVKNLLGRSMILAAFALFLSVFTGNAFADTDALTTAITSIGGYWTAVEVIAVGVLLFVVGRRIVRKV